MHDTGIIRIVDENLRQGFAQVPRPVLRAKGLSLKAKVVYVLLLDYAWQQGSCFPGHGRLADDLDVSVDTVQRALTELKRFGLIDWKRQGLNRPNIYYLLPLAENPRLMLADSGNRNLRFPETAVLRRQETAASGSKDTQVTIPSKTFRKALAEKSDEDTKMNTIPADTSAPDQTVSRLSHDPNPGANGEGETQPSPATTVVVPANASDTAARSSEPAPARTRVLTDPAAASDPSETTAGHESEGFRRLRDQAMKIREEMERERGQAGETTADAPLRLEEVLVRHQAVRSVTTPTGTTPQSPVQRGRPPLTQEERELRERFGPFVAHMATKLHDEAALASSLGRFVNAYLAARERRPGLPPEAMFVVGEEALEVTQHYSPGIRALASSAAWPGTKAKMGYWFALVEVKLGLEPDRRAATYPPGSPPPGA
jgi:hypothetical protein